MKSNGHTRTKRLESEHDLLLCALYTVATLIAVQIHTDKRKTRTTLREAVEGMGQIEGYHLRIQELSRGQMKGRDLCAHLDRAAWAFGWTR